MNERDLKQLEEAVRASKRASRHAQWAFIAAAICATLSLIVNLLRLWGGT